MRLVRTILALAIAVSLALLPLGTAGAFAMAHDDAKAGMRMTASTDMSMDDCCPDDMKGPPSQTDRDKCSMGFCCIGPSASLAEIAVTHFDVLSSRASRLPIPADQVVSFNGGSPPFRPPRV